MPPLPRFDPYSCYLLVSTIREIPASSQAGVVLCGGRREQFCMRLFTVYFSPPTKTTSLFPQVRQKLSPSGIFIGPLPFSLSPMERALPTKETFLQLIEYYWYAFVFVRQRLPISLGVRRGVEGSRKTPAILPVYRTYKEGTDAVITACRVL